MNKLFLRIHLWIQQIWNTDMYHLTEGLIYSYRPTNFGSADRNHYTSFHYFILCIHLYCCFCSLCSIHEVQLSLRSVYAECEGSISLISEFGGKWRRLRWHSALACLFVACYWSPQLTSQNCHISVFYGWLDWCLHTCRFDFLASINMKYCGQSNFIRWCLCASYSTKNTLLKTISPSASVGRRDADAS